MIRTILTVFSILMLTAGLNAQHTHEDEGIAIPLPNQLKLVTQADVQESMSLSKAHNAFRSFAVNNSDWEFRYDAMRRTPHRAWGSGIRIEGYPSINLLNAPQAGKQFIDTHAGILNVNPANLRLLYSEIVSGKAYQKYIQTYNGIDVLDSYVDLRISRDARVFMFGSDFHPRIDVNTIPAVSLDAAREFAKAGLPYTPSNDHVTGGTMYVLPLQYSDHIDYRLVYNFQVAAAQDELWDTYVDAHSGNIIWRHDLITHFHGGKSGINGAANVVNGRVMIKIYPESYTDEEVSVPLKNAYVWVSGTMYTTDAEGRFTADLGSNTTGQLVTRLTGPYAIVRRDDTTRVSGGSPANAYQTVSVASGQNLEVVWDNSNSIASERNTFYHMNLVRDFSRALDASANNNRLDVQIPGLVEINSQCNAFFDGTGVNFFQSSLQCGNTGEISSVIHHEMGHGIHIWLTAKLTGRGPVNGAIKEAVADLTTNMLRDDPRIGVGFMKGQSNGGIIRNSENTLRYPEDVVNEIHDDGMILTGAVWDVRKAIGLERTSQLYHDVMYGTPDGVQLGVALADYFVEFLVADDDDGDLSNGTPNSEAIITAFNDHGIPGSAIQIVHGGMTDQNSVTEPYDIVGVAKIGGDINMDLLNINRVDIVYSADNWASSERITASYNPSTQSFTGSVPPQKAGTIVHYYIEAHDNYGTSLRDPMGAPQTDYIFLVGYKSVYMHDGASEDGWKVISDATTGEWILDEPVGTWNTQLGQEGSVPYVQPNEDHTPGAANTQCWVTGNAARGAGLGTNDVDDGETWLVSGKIDISGMSEPVLRYFRWFSNDAGATPGTDFWTVQLSSNGGGSWEYLERTKAADASWKPRVYVLSELIDFTDEMVVQFIAADNGEGSLIEAAVDDIEVLDIDASLLDVDDQPLPLQLTLAQNYPNPFNPATTISYSLPQAGNVRLTVYNSLGDEVRTLVNTYQSAGTHALVFDADELASGLYVYELRAGGKRLKRKMMLLE